MTNLNLIWQTKEGEPTEFEYEYITEILFKKLDFITQFDYGSFKTVKDNSVIIYSEPGNNASPELIHYLNKFVRKKYRFYLLHLSNEGLNHNCWYYAKANYVFRNYYDPKIKLNNIQYIPLGFKSGYLNKENKIDDCHQRKIDIAFIGQPKSDRFEMINEIEKLDSYYLHKTHSWNCATAMSQSESIEIYNKTKYAPCPMGQIHPDSFRVCEALEWGCIPIVKKAEGKDYFTSIFGNHPFKVLDEWSTITAIVADKDYCQNNQLVHNWYLNFKENLQLRIQQIIESQEIRNCESFTSKDMQFESIRLYNILKRSIKNIAKGLLVIMKLRQAK